MAPAAIRWDVMFSGEALKQLLCAALFGPLVNTVLHVLLTIVLLTMALLTMALLPRQHGAPLPTHYGATYYGATYYGATYYGSAYYGATYYGATDLCRAALGVITR